MIIMRKAASIGGDQPLINQSLSAFPNKDPVGNDRNIEDHIPRKGKRSWTCLESIVDCCSSSKQTVGKSHVYKLGCGVDAIRWLQGVQCTESISKVWCIRSHKVFACGFFAVVAWDLVRW
jgi:hypothetical protein